MVQQSSNPELGLVFAALADPTRRRILELLSAGEQCVTDLARPFQMSLAAVSKHLRVLERAGLLLRRREGRVHHLRADPVALADAQAWIQRYVKGWNEGLDSLDAFLARTHGPSQSPPSPEPTQRTESDSPHPHAEG